MFNALGLQVLILHIALQGVHFRNRIGYGSAGHEIYATAIVFALQVSALDEQVQSFRRTGDIPQTGYIHGRGVAQIFELMAFIHEQCVNTQIAEVHGTVFFSCTGK